MIAFKIGRLIGLSLFCILASATQEANGDETDNPCIKAIEEKFGKHRNKDGYARSAFLNLKSSSVEGDVKEYYLEIFERTTARSVFSLPQNYCEHVYQYGEPIKNKISEKTKETGAILNRQLSRTMSKGRTAVAAAPEKAKKLGEKAKETRATLSRQLSQKALKGQKVVATAAAAAAKAAEQGKNYARSLTGRRNSLSGTSDIESENSNNGKNSKRRSSKSDTSGNESESSNNGRLSRTASLNRSLSRATSMGRNAAAEAIVAAATATAKAEELGKKFNKGIKRTATMGRTAVTTAAATASAKTTAIKNKHAQIKNEREENIKKCVEQFKQENFFDVPEGYDNFKTGGNMIRFIYEHKTIKEYEDKGLNYVASYLKYAVKFVTVSDTLRTLDKFCNNPIHTANTLFKISFADKIIGKEKLNNGIQTAKSTMSKLPGLPGRFRNGNKVDTTPAA